jgi:hypothetical protein
MSHVPCPREREYSPKGDVERIIFHQEAEHLLSLTFCFGKCIISFKYWTSSHHSCGFSMQNHPITVRPRINHLAITGKPRITMPTSEKCGDLCKMWNRK